MPPSAREMFQALPRAEQQRRFLTMMYIVHHGQPLDGEGRPVPARAEAIAAAFNSTGVSYMDDAVFRAFAAELGPLIKMRNPNAIDYDTWIEAELAAKAAAEVS